MRIGLALCALLAITWGLGRGTAYAQQAGEPEWKPVTVDGEVYFAIPADVVRSLGLRYEDIPDEQNAATYYFEAINALPPLDEEDEVLRRQYGDGRNGPWRLDDGAFSTWFQSTAEARGLFGRAAGMERCQSPILAASPGDTRLSICPKPHLAGMRKLGRLMVIEGHLHEQEGRTQEALEAYLLVFRAVRHVHRGGALIDGLVGTALHAIATEAVAGCLRRHDVESSVLERLARELTALEPPPTDRRAWITWERTANLQVARMPPTDWLAGACLADPERIRRPRPFLDSRAFRIVWPDRTICKDFGRFYDRLDEFAQMPTWEAMGALQEFQEASFFKDWNVLGRMLAPNVSHTMSGHARAASRHAALRINVALRRFRADEARYPDSLEQLVPRYLKEVPLDPLAGVPFRYRHEDGAWVLSSAAADQKHAAVTRPFSLMTTLDSVEKAPVYRSDGGDNKRR